jgi:hypothetical protein
MRLKRVLAIAAGVAVLGVGAAVASHVPQVDPATVPPGFLAAHNEVSVRKGESKALRRIANRRRVDVFVQHIRLGANEATGWHTHPGPVVVTVVKGSFTYEDEFGNECRRTTYDAGEGFVDRGFGHVHRGIAGAAGVDLYATYILPRGSAAHLIPADPPEECTEQDDDD